MLCLASLVFAGAALRATLSVQRWDEERVLTRDSLGPPSRCAARATVLASPTWQGGATSFVAAVNHVDCEGRAVAPLVARLHGGPDDLARGDELDVVIDVAPTRLFFERELADPRPAATRRRVHASGAVLTATVTRTARGLSALIDHARARARRRIFATYPAAAEPLARALVLGETDLDPEDDRAFRQSGLSHLLAVSGTHLVVAVLALVKLFTALLVRVPAWSATRDVGRFAALAGAPAALVYADFAGGSGSALRAAWMLAAALLVRALGRWAPPSRAIAASLLIGVLVDPLAAFDVSFALSAAATAGLVVIGPALSAQAMRLRPAPLAWLAGTIATTLSAMLPCLPLLAILSDELGVAGTLANVVAGPLGELMALPLCLLHLLTASVPTLELGIARVASGSLLFVRAVAQVAASVECLRLRVPSPDGWQLALSGVTAVAVLMARSSRRRWACVVVGALGVLGVEAALRHAGSPQGELRITVLDVGQGDATLVDLPDGRLMLIDGGGFMGSPVDPGQSVIAPVLRARRRQRVDVAVLSHPHPDHFTGLVSALRTVEVGELWDSGQGEKEGALPLYAVLLAELRARGVPVRRPAELCGVHRFGAAEVRLLAPCPGFVPGRGANDNSLVLRVSLGARAALLTGDAEAEEEVDLVREHGPELGADLLKVGHHGSRTSSSPALLAAVHPRFATLSCGVRNPYGHPHAVTLEKLADRAILALRSDRYGSIEWRTRGTDVALTTFGPPR